MSIDGASAGRRIALVVHPRRPDAKALAEVAEQWWRSHGYEVVADLVGEEGELSPALASGAIDYAISLGGDGTMLRTIQLVGERRAPVLGVNLGHLGYLTQVEPTQIASAFERLVAGEAEIEERMTLEVALETADPERRRTLVALNEAVVEKTTPGHTIRLQVSIGGRAFLTYEADGILVATPTGSTAYNLSLRGPIVSPSVRALVFTPISPHMLFDHSLVLEPDETVRLELLDDRPAVVVVDGSIAATLEPGDAVQLSANGPPARIVRFGRPDFHAILRAKFNLQDR